MSSDDAVRILVVDDEPDLEFLVKQRFRKKIADKEWFFEFALNGVEALRKIGLDKNITLILTDINMPEMDGLTLLEHLKEQDRTLKTVVISAYGDMQNIRTAMNRGAFDFITKPISFEDLELTIHKSLLEIKLLEEGVSAKRDLKIAQRESELARKEKELAEVEKMRAEQSEKFKQQFLANMSHEIRTPMNAVMGMANLLAKSKLDEQQSKHLNVIRQSSENLLVIINDILDLSKIEAGKLEFEKVDFDVRGIIESVCNTLRFKSEEKKLALNSEVNESVPSFVNGDPVRLSQILINLAGNAVKFTDSGSVTMKVEGKKGKNPGITELQFEIIDTGIGIAKDKLNSIFESFTQASSDTTRKYGGTGLGLTISKQLVELQGGEISVQSTQGKGTTFSFKIPYTETLAAPVKPTLHHSANGDISSLNKLRILLVEDNKFNQMVATDILLTEAPLLKIDIADNGRIAIEKLAENTYDLILMDVQMPEMDGYEAAEYIREKMEDQNNIPILAMTASATKGEIDRCYTSGMNDYISKPFVPKELFQKIVNLAAHDVSLPRV